MEEEEEEDDDDDDDDNSNYVGPIRAKIKFSVHHSMQASKAKFY